MGINCTDYLFFHKHADFFVYDKRSAYLYPIDILHFEIGEKLKDVFQHSGVTLNVQHFIQNKKEYDASIVREHYDFILNLLSESKHAANIAIIPISESDIINSISIVPHIVVEVTERCNFSCNYCYYGGMYDTIPESEQRIQDMPEEDCLQCLRELLIRKNVLYSNKAVISFYGGEPFLNFRLIRKIVSLCREEFPEIEFQFRTTTNGSLLKTHIEFLKEHDFHILVSIDGDKQSDIYRCYNNGRQAFTDVKENIDYLYNEYRDYFLSNIEFISVLHRDSDIISICRFFSRYEKTPLLTNLSTEGIIANKQMVFPYEGVDHQEMQTLYNTNRSIYDLIKQAGKETLSINRQFSNTDKFSPRGCYLFANKIFLAANRQIYLCEKSSRKFPFGSFSNNHLRFYINEINRYYNDFDKVVRNECPDCSLHYMCDRCFFEEPSLMIAPLKCKLPETNIRERLIKSLEHE